jgi:GT2 family glycosyltransferase
MSASSPAEPTLTVVVPTRDRPADLRACLEALDRERRSCPELDEVVIVDDGSVLEDEVAGAVDAVPAATLVRRRPGGIAAARNTGVRAARGAFVAFTDDDCVPQPGWAQALVLRLRGGAAVVAGETLSGSPHEALPSALQLVSNAAFSNGGRPWAGPGSNLASRRELVLDVPFDEHYEKCGDERDWDARVSAQGHKVVYAPEARVLHFPKLTAASFWRKHFSYGRSAYRFRRDHGSGRLDRPGFYLGLIRAGFRAGPRTGFAVCVAQLATAAGFATEAAASRAG